MNGEMTNKRDIFIEKAKQVHKDENLDYSKVVYVNNRTKVTIIDNDLKEDGTTFGEYQIIPSNFLKGQSHPLKRGLKISKSKRFTTEHIIEMFKNKHGEEECLDYSQVVYKGMDVPVIIICHALDVDGNEYGEFKQTPRIHLKGCTHPRLSMDRNLKKQFKTTDYFIDKSKGVHGNTYDYSKSDYNGNDKKIEVICLKHGSFWITPENHYAGKGCPKCGNHLSYNEEELLSFLRSNDVQCVHNDRSVLDGMELDIYVPSKGFAIEYNGLRWHSEEFNKGKYYHLNKTLKCKEKGIKLIHIFEDEYINNKDIVYEKLKHLINIGVNLPKIMGRKCSICEIKRDIAQTFLDKYHIQGFARSTVYLGAFYGDLLIAVMTFTKENKNSLKWELNRFASDYNYVCQGIGGKLFSYFKNNYDYSTIKSFADRRWTVEDINLYTKLGFKLDKILPPDYTYYSSKISECKRFHKFLFRKHLLIKKYGLDVNMTEYEMTKKLGYYRVWNCGLLKYVFYKE